MTAAHFVFIPVVLLIGVYVGWDLRSRIARDQAAAQKKKEEETAEAQRTQR